jgi:hypothetical protein
MPLTSRTFDQLINFTRTSAATFVGSNGLIQTTPASVNLLTFTQEFDNAAWSNAIGGTGVNPVISANAGAAPDGTNTADRLQFSLGGGTTLTDLTRRLQNYSTLGSTTYTFSVYLRSFDGSSTYNMHLVGADSLTTNIVVTGAWQRFTVTTSRVGAATIGYAIGLRGGQSPANSNTADVLAWGAQLELGSTATTYTRNFGGVFPPRFDYNPVTLTPLGLLIEEQRTNLQTYSADFTNAVWAKTNITVTAAAAVSPDGTSNAQKIEATASAGTTFTGPATAVAATSATFSVYVKQGTGATTANAFLLRNNTTATNLIAGTLNYSTGVWTYSIGSTGVVVTNAGNGWWRVQITASSGITSGDSLIAYVGFTGGAHTAGDHLFAYGAQLETGAFASSYIPTVASQVTRSADFAVISSPNFLPWYNQTEGTLLVEADSVVPGTAGLYRSAALSDGTLNNLIQTFVFIGTWGATGSTAGVTQFDLQPAASYTRDAPAKFGLAFRANDFAASVNNSTPLTDSSGTVATMSQLNIGSLPSSGQINGHVRRVTFYPSRLTNTQLQALTL